MSRRRVIPGFGLSLGYSLFWVTVLVMVPLGALALKSAQLTWGEFWQVISSPVVLHSYKLSFGASLAAAAVNAVFGLIVAWVLVRYPFPGRRIVDAMVDFPFALPTAVAGLTFSSLYMKEGWIGGLGNTLVSLLNGAAGWAGLGSPISPSALSWLSFPYTNTAGGVVIVLIFVGMPFVVRTVQPVLQDVEREVEEAAASLGAGRWYTFRRVIFPALLPAWISGLALAFARAVGEYGSVIFIAGNIPGKSQIAPLQIVTQLDDFRYPQATAIGLVLLVTSLLVLLALNGVEWWSRRQERR